MMRLPHISCINHTTNAYIILRDFVVVVMVINDLITIFTAAVMPQRQKVTELVQRVRISKEV